LFINPVYVLYYATTFTRPIMLKPRKGTSNAY